MKYENQILDAIETIVDNAVNKAGYDRTIQAKIINCDDPTIGKYKVQYQDSIFYAYSGSSEINYTNNSEVYVLIPNNDMSRDKTILGSVSKLGKNYAVAAEGEEAFEIIGNNCVESSNNYSLCSYKTTNEYVIYNKNSSTANHLRLNLKSINEYIKSSTSITLAATIKTSLPTEQQFRGNYGILYEMVFKDNGSEELVTRNYVLDVNQFEGNPYKMPNFKRQVGIFDIDGINFQYINKISLFCYDFPNQNSTKSDDIFIKNFEIYGSQALTAKELESCSLSFITPQGVYFDNNDLASATRTIQAQVRVKGKYINPETQKLPYYWFVENNGITSLSEDFNAYGGQGWKCLNAKNVVKSGSNGIAPVVEWIPADYKYTIRKSDSAAKETKYKCVVIYNDIILSKTFTIINYSSTYEISITSDKGNQFYYDIGNPTLTCLINGQESTSSVYTYQWAELDNNNNFYALAENDTVSLTKVDNINQMINQNQVYVLSNYIYTFYNNNWINTNINITNEQWNNDNKIYNNAVAGYTSLKASIAAETAMAAASQAQLNIYLTIINSYDKIMRVEGRKIHHLQVNTITNFATYKCSVYRNGVYIGTSSIVIRNDLDKKDAYTLVINNGTQTFKYNESGVSPASNSLDNPQVILPLSFTIYDNLGNALDDDIISNCEIKWIAPSENTLIKVTQNQDYPWLPYNNGLIIKDKLIIYYDINDRYNVKSTNNTIQLTVNYKGMNLVAETDFTFVKEGEPGTNGTEFVCRIVPNTQNTGFGYPMVLNGNINYTPRQSGRWFNVQLWHNGNKIFEGSTSGNTSENKNATVQWSILKNKYTTNLYDATSLSVTNAGVFTYLNYEGANSPANIVKATITYDNVQYYCTIPVITATASNGYGISLNEGTGFRYATYSADGRKPQYDNSNPFELKVTKVINNITEDISILTQSNAVTYNWNIRGRIYDTVNSIWVDSLHLGVYNRSDMILERNQASYKPLDNFDGECVTNGLECIVKNNNNTEVARIHIPIHLLLNKYGHAAINGWDGNSVSIDKNGNGVILAPQIGAGQKENDNSFTGILMGSVKEAGKNTADVGLFGYSSGERSIFLNSKDGSAIFGKSGPGQIIIDPSANKAMLYSNGYWKNYKEDGKPTSYGAANKNDSGMLIDLTTPLIEWGNGNFKVDVNGHITAKGGGTIAGFNIDDDSIFTGTKSSNSNLRISSSNGLFTRTINGTSRENLNLAISNKFAVDSSGILYTRDAIIEGEITADRGRIGGFTITNSSIYNNKDSLTAESSGVYIGTNGISLGADSTFKVTKNGALSASNVSITGGSLTIGDTFKVTSGGALTAESGKIGGWTINSDQLKSTNGNTHIYASGQLRGPNWEIDANGNATFSNIKITSSGYSSSRGDLINYGAKFKVQSDGTLHASNGQFNGNISSSSISGGSVNGAAITGGTLDVSTPGGGYLIAGIGIKNVKVSGLTVTEDGIDMDGNGLSHCSGASNTGGSSNYTCAGNMSVRGDNSLYLRGASSANAIFVYTNSSGFVTLKAFIQGVVNGDY